MGVPRGWLTAAFVIAALVTAALGARLIIRAAYWATHQDVAIEGWMTVGYVARSRGLEPADLIKALGDSYTLGDRRALAALAAARGVPLDQLIAEIEAGLAKARGSAP
jgi:hypothetical protein